MNALLVSFPRRRWNAAFSTSQRRALQAQISNFVRFFRPSSSCLFKIYDRFGYKKKEKMFICML